MGLKETDIQQLKSALASQCEGVRAASDLEMLRRDWLGKEGTLKRLFKELGELDPSERPATAAVLNELRSQLEDFLREKESHFAQAKVSEKLNSEFVDLSLPGDFAGRGELHPISRLDRRVSEILRPFGVVCADGPEIETEYFCFDSLNIQKHHPARDMQDTFYTNTGELLRTHTTSVQARVLKKGGNVKIISPGRVFRNETIDASHTAMFHQFELIWIEKGLTLSNLMAILQLIAKELYGKRVKIRFKPKYYPYTEPSVGLDVACSLCKGAGCAGCGHAGWATVVGSGMVHHKVLKEFGYDPAEVSGIAFGFGTTRLAAQFFNLPRLKMIYENDLRLLKSI